jgi:hypothetical protein
MANQVTTIVIKGKVGYEDEISPAQAAQIIAFLNVNEGAAPTIGGPALSDMSSARESTRKVESAREALDISGAKTNPEKIVALGAYVLQDGGDTFKTEDVKTQFRRARETAPGNFARDLSTAVQIGWLAEDRTGEYYITNKIQGIFDGDFKFPKSGGSAKPRSASRNRPAASKSTRPKNGGKPKAFADIDEFPTTMDGFQPYSKMKNNKDKLLWAVKFAKSVNIKGLANKDIEWLTDHLGAGIPNKQISAAFSSAQSSGYANRSTQDSTIRITSGGEAYLATVGVPQSRS